MTCPICDEYPVDCSCARKALRRLVEVYHVTRGADGRVYMDGAEVCYRQMRDAWDRTLRVLNPERADYDEEES